MKLSEVTGSSDTMKLSQVGKEPAPEYYGTGDFDPNMTAADVGKMGKGFVEGVVGLPAAVGRSLFKFGRQTPQDYDTSLFKPEKDQRAAGYRELGNVAGSAVSPLPVGKGAKVAGEVIERVLPGATRRAASLVERIAKPGNVNDIGEAIKAKLAPRFQEFENTRRVEFQKWLAQQGKKDVAAARADDPAFDAAFRKKYGELSQDINQFADSLGKHAAGEAKDPISLPQKAFSSRASVQSLLRLSGNDSVAVADLARQWTSRELRRVTEPFARAGKPDKAAQAARRWLTEAEEKWMGEIHGLPEETEQFVSAMEKVARTQGVAKKAGAVAGGGLAAGLGVHYLPLPSFGH